MKNAITTSPASTAIFKLFSILNKQEHLKSGHSLYKQGEFLKARLYYKLIPDLSSNTTVLIRLGDIEFDLFEYQKALNYYQLARSNKINSKTELRLERKIALCKFELKQGVSRLDRKYALKHFEQRVTIHSIYKNGNRSLEVINSLLKLNELSLLRADELYMLACSYYSQRKLENAKVYLAKALARGLDRISDLELKYKIAKSNKEFTTAEEIALELYHYTKSDKSLIMLANINFAKNDFSLACQRYEKFFVNARSDYERERFKYGLCLRELGRFDEAREEFRTLPPALTSIDGIGENIYASPNPLSILQKRKSSTSLGLLDPKAPLISIVLVTMRPEKFADAYENFCKQDYPNKELVAVLNRANFDHCIGYIKAHQDSRVKLIQGGDALSLGALFALGVSHSAGEIIAKMDDDDEYGSRYLSSSSLPVIQNKAEIAGKTTRFVYLEKEDSLYLRLPGFANNPSVQNISGSSMILRKSLIDKLGWPDMPSGEDSEFLRRVLDSNGVIASSSEFDYLVNRRADIASHTWKSEDVRIRKSSALIAHGKNASIVLD
jgi:tetratricopeptide (TPR) repeat protein